MDEATVRKYIVHRLKIAGGTGKEFSAGACKDIAKASSGVPRLVNQLCEFAMLYAWGDDHRQVTVRTVANVLKDGVFFGSLNSDEEDRDYLFLSNPDRVDLPEEKEE